MVLGQRLEAFEDHPLDANRLAFLHLDRDVDRLLIVTELRVERLHARIGITAVSIKRDDPLQIRLELPAIEVLVLAPRQPGAHRRGEHGPELTIRDGVDAPELERFDFDAAPLFDAGGDQRKKQEQGREAGDTQRTHGGRSRSTHKICQHGRGVNGRRTNEEPENVFPETASGSSQAALFSCDFRLPRGDRHHDAQTDGDDHADQHPDRGELAEDTAVPQCRHRADQDDEVPNQVQIHESHFASIRDRAVSARC